VSNQVLEHYGDPGGSPRFRAIVRPEEKMKVEAVLLVALIGLLGGCWVGGPKEKPVDIEFFTRSTGVSMPSATDFSGVQGSSDAFGDYSVAMSFSAGTGDISNLVAQLPRVLGTNWTTTTQAKTFSVGGPTAYHCPSGALCITKTGPENRTRTIIVDTRLNRVSLFHASW